MFDTEQYVRGLCWNLNMYLDGCCPDVTFRSESASIFSWCVR